MKPIYFWEEGVDSRHFTITKVFKRLKDAVSMIETIDDKRAFRIVRRSEKEIKTILERVV
jgi:hypothetical protein